MAGTQMPCSSSAAEACEGPLLAPQHHRHDRGGVAGRHPLHVPRQAGTERRALRRSQDAEAARAAAASAGAGAVVKM